MQRRRDATAFRKPSHFTEHGHLLISNMWQRVVATHDGHTMRRELITTVGGLQASHAGPNVGAHLARTAFQALYSQPAAQSLFLVLAPQFFHSWRAAQQKRWKGSSQLNK